MLLFTARMHPSGYTSIGDLAGIIHLLIENRGLKKESEFTKIEKIAKKNRSIYSEQNRELRRNTPLR